MPLRFFSVLRSRGSRLLLVLAGVLAAGTLFHLWVSEAALAVPWVPDRDAEQFARRPLGAAPAASFLDGGLFDNNDGGRNTTAPYALPLRARGRHIVDAAGRRFRLAAVNWYGASDVHMVPGGLDVQHRTVLARTIRRLGFNTVRLPYADEMVARNPRVPPARVAANADLAGQPALDVFAAVVAALTDAGLAVVVNNHITAATWCCGADPCDAGWANDRLPAAVAAGWRVWQWLRRGGYSGSLCRVPQTEADWIDHWTTVMARFADNPHVIGADLRNEVRGLWGTQPWARWAAAAELCGARLLALQPGWLIIVGGTASGNDLRGVARRPVRLGSGAAASPTDSQVVYSAHVYGWSGWGSGPGGRYSQRSYAAFAAAMRRRWAFLVEDDAAPVWVGEFGAPHRASIGDARYWRHLVRFLAALDADWGYWAVNPRKPATNSPETYGLVEDDWLTPVLDYRMRDLAALMGLEAV